MIMAKFIVRITSWVCGCFLLLLMSSVLLFYRDLQCATDTSVHILNSLCLAYHQGRLLGDLCSQICDGQNFTYNGCGNYAGGKVTLIGQLNNNAVVLKAKRPYFTDYDPVYFIDDASVSIPRYSEFFQITSETIQYSMNIIDKNHTLIDRMWTLHLSDYLANKTSQMASMQSMWSLLQQDEYVFMKYLAGVKYVPSILGTCGHMYAVEFAPPGRLFTPNVLHMSDFSVNQAPSWEERLATALLLIELLRVFDEHFHEPLHICDLKGSNFGINVDNMLKIIDWDMVVFNSKLNMIFAATNCSHASDCSFVDCYSYCDISAGMCIPDRINTNLQLVCKHIFMDSVSNLYSGLLRSPPEDIDDKLSILLNQCATSQLEYDSNFYKRNAHSKELSDRFYNLLSQHLYKNYKAQLSDGTIL